MLIHKDRPYNELPLLPLKPEQWESMDVYRKLAEARAALAELKGRAPIIPNPLMLINTLAIQEAKDSSSIENIVTTSDNLYKALISPAAKYDNATKEVLKYREAIWKSHLDLEKNKPLGQDIIINIFRTITGKDENIRNVQVRIGNFYSTAYTPPEPGKILEEKLNNWFGFANTSDNIDPLIKMAILHHQFESIHPFSDGNGRTGRVFNVLYLDYLNLLELPILYLSKYILENKDEYYRLLNVVRETDNWNDWILYMLDAILHTARFTLDKVNAIYHLFQTTQEKIKNDANDIYSYELVETLFSQTYCKIAVLVEKGIASRNTASRYLKRLTEMGILTQQLMGNEMLYLNHQLYEILAKG